MEMKMMLSIPRTISNANSVAKAIQACGSAIQSTDGIPPCGYQSAPHHISSRARAQTLSVVVKAGVRAGGGRAWRKKKPGCHPRGVAARSRYPFEPPKRFWGTATLACTRDRLPDLYPEACACGGSPPVGTG